MPRTEPPQDTTLRYERVASELIRALRGKRSCAELSRRAGYRSNIVHRWEAGQCWPTAAGFLALHARQRPGAASWITSFLHKAPDWASQLDASSPKAVAAFLRHVRGKTPILRIAEIAQCNRYSVSRWLAGSSEPKLPDFLRLVDACSRRLVDLVAALEDPSRLPSLRDAWQRQQLAREAAYDKPWSHAVLRALELHDSPRGLAAQQAFIARKLGIGSDEVRDALRVLEAMAQVKKSRGRFVPREVTAIDTGSDPLRARELKLAWTRTALERLQSGADGSYGWSVFAVSKADLARLNHLHLAYVRAMREVIASSSPSECVGLYCAQLLDLGAE
jgi:transcriptional regulator with XRE-family HTH domain